MINLGLRAVHHLVVVILYTPTEVDFFHVGEKCVVQATEFMVNIRSYEHAGSGSPEHFLDVVVLSVVSLQMLEHSAATERIAVFVDETASCTSIFKLFLVMIGEYLGLASRYAAVAVHQLDNRLNPMRRHFDVGVEQTIIFCFNLT